MPTPTVYVSSPRLSIDNQFNQSLSNNTISVLVEETTDGLYRCEARFFNYGLRPGGGPGYLYFDGAILDFGKEIKIEMGPGDQARRIFSGRISALEAEYPRQGGGQIVALAEDRLQNLRLTRRTRSFENLSVADIIQQVASDHNLSPQVDLPGPAQQVVTQVNQSDLAFIRELARQLGGEVWVEDTTLYAKTRTARQEPPLTLEYGLNLLAFTVRADLARQCTELGVAGWDVAAKEQIQETAQEQTITAELNGDTSGSAFLQKAFGPRKERLVHTVPLTSQEARNIAEARYREEARRFITGTGLADGDARLRVGRQIDLSGLGSRFDGTYYIAQVRHTYDQSFGFRTEFEVERPGLGPTGT